MFNYVWPVVLAVCSNVLYQVFAKSVPENMNPLASLTITYIVGAVTSLTLYYLLNKNANIFQEYKAMNFAPILLGLVIVGLEVGFIYAYKYGWGANSLQIVQSGFAAIALITH